MLRKKCALAVLCIEATLATPATLTTTMSVAASVTTSCSSFSSSGLNFGSLPQDGGATGIATVSVICGNSVPYQIATNGGGYPVCVGGVYYYQMGGSASPRYQLFADAARTVELAHTVIAGCAAGSSLSGTGTGSAQTLTIYAAGTGTSASGEPVSAGSYSDTVTLTLTF